MKVSLTTIPVSDIASRRSKYAEIVDAVRNAPTGQAVCVECESKAEMQRVHISAIAFFRPERGGDPTKRLASSRHGLTLYLWVVPKEPESPQIATRFIKSA